MQAVAVIVTGQQGVCAAVGESPNVGTPTTVKFNQFQLGSNDLPLSDRLLAPSGGPNSPEQIHLTLGSGMDAPHDVTQALFSTRPCAR